ncbi:MAG: hypothetical protein ACRDRV_06310 [Pseudonocardiaceae bacterium]
MRRRDVRAAPPSSSFAGFRFPPDVIIVAVRWYLRYALSYRDVEELLAERGIELDELVPSACHVIEQPTHPSAAPSTSTDMPHDLRG